MISYKSRPRIASQKAFHRWSCGTPPGGIPRWGSEKEKSLGNPEACERCPKGWFAKRLVGAKRRSPKGKPPAFIILRQGSGKEKASAIVRLVGADCAALEPQAFIILRQGSGKEKASAIVRLVGADCAALEPPAFIILRQGSGKEKASAIVRLVGAEGLEPPAFSV